MPVRFICSQLKGEMCLSTSGWDDPPLPTQMCDGAAEIDRIPMNDGTDDQIQPGGSECLALERAIPNFSAFME